MRRSHVHGRRSPAKCSLYCLGGLILACYVLVLSRHFLQARSESPAMPSSLPPVETTRIDIGEPHSNIDGADLWGEAAVSAAHVPSDASHPDVHPAHPQLAMLDDASTTVVPVAPMASRTWDEQSGVDRGSSATSGDVGKSIVPHPTVATHPTLTTTARSRRPPSATPTPSPTTQGHRHEKIGSLTPAQPSTTTAIPTDKAERDHAAAAAAPQQRPETPAPTLRPTHRDDAPAIVVPPLPAVVMSPLLPPLTPSLIASNVSAVSGGALGGGGVLINSAACDPAPSAADDLFVVHWTHVPKVATVCRGASGYPLLTASVTAARAQGGRQCVRRADAARRVPQEPRDRGDQPVLRAQALRRRVGVPRERLDLPALDWYRPSQFKHGPTADGAVLRPRYVVFSGQMYCVPSSAPRQRGQHA